MVCCQSNIQKLKSEVSNSRHQMLMFCQGQAFSAASYMSCLMAALILLSYYHVITRKEISQVARLEAEKAALAQQAVRAEATQAATLKAVNQRLAEVILKSCSASSCADAFRVPKTVPQNQWLSSAVKQRLAEVVPAPCSALN